MISHQGQKVMSYLDSSPIRYASSSSPVRAANGSREQDGQIPSSTNGLFMSSSRSRPPDSDAINQPRRSDIHSDVFAAGPNRRRRLFVDENGLPVSDGPGNSDAATFSNVNPNTSEADESGGTSTRIIWGTNISIQDTMTTFKDFLLGYRKKYRMWADGATEDDASDPNSGSNEREYVEMMKIMLALGVTGLNLDLRNLKSYPTTVKLWHQVQAYPHEIIPIMDQTIKDLMLELAEKETARQRAERQQIPQSAPRFRDPSSMPPMPSSDIPSSAPDAVNQVPDLVQEVETKTYKVKPFGLDGSINMRELNPNGRPPIRLILMFTNYVNRHGQDDQY